MNGKDSAESELDFQKKRAFKALQTSGSDYSEEK